MRLGLGNKTSTFIEEYSHLHRGQRRQLERCFLCQLADPIETAGIWRTHYSSLTDMAWPGEREAASCEWREEKRGRKGREERKEGVRSEVEVAFATSAHTSLCHVKQQ